MNRRTLILVSLVVLLVAALWWLTRPIATPLPALSVTMARPTPAAIKTALPPLFQRLTYEVPKTGKYQGLNDSRWKWWHAMEKQDSSFEWKMPINFYGKVVDGNGLPIQNAKIRFQWTDTSTKGTSEKFTESNADGTFSLTRENGKALGVYVTKPGFHAGVKSFGSYEYAAFFEWDYHEPDKNSPVIFRLDKKIPAEPLLTYDTFYQLSYEPGIYYYNLQQGKLSRQQTVEDGLKFTLTRSETPQGKPFDWTWTVEGVKAAVQLTTEEFPQSAPADAYVPSWKIEEKADAEDFRRQGTVRLYVRTGNGRYAVVDLQLSHPNKREIGPTLSVKSYLNPSGSRNLEYDPSKTVKAGN